MCDLYNLRLYYWVFLHSDFLSLYHSSIIPWFSENLFWLVVCLGYFFNYFQTFSILSHSWILIIDLVLSSKFGPLAFIVTFHNGFIFATLFHTSTYPTFLYKIFSSSAFYWIDFHIFSSSPLLLYNFYFSLFILHFKQE